MCRTSVAPNGICQEVETCLPMISGAKNVKLDQGVPCGTKRRTIPAISPAPHARARGRKWMRLVETVNHQERLSIPSASLLQIVSISTGDKPRLNPVLEAM